MRRMAPLPLTLLLLLIILFSVILLRRPTQQQQEEEGFQPSCLVRFPTSSFFISNPHPSLAMKWIIMIAVVAAYVLTTISMKRHIKGNQGASAGDTNTGSVVSRSIMESVRSKGSDRDTHTSITSEYDVFLSFCGPDVRHGIVDHLYQRMTEAGLRVFKDDEEIRRGEVIGGELERAIRGSRVYAIVFSRNYATSAWCLRELDMMLDLHGGSNVGRKIILPIFYGADPADVKLRTELYRKALVAHKDRRGHDIVKKWEKALKTVGGISGWDCKAIQGEGTFVRLIVQEIIVKLRIKDQILPDHLTGIDGRVSDMLNLLDCDSSGVRLVVLHGMGGIGKTTLASIVFNELSSQFEGSSFISNVRESAMDHGGIAKLQNKLSRDILGGRYASCNFDEGFDEIIQRIRGKRMLLVLDDVDPFSQLEKLIGKNPEDTLGAGSRVIITTRDKSICDQFVRLSSKLLHFYEMEKMADNHALQLFSKHAFGTDEPLEDYLSLSKQIIKTTGNLPLALVVTARHLCCQSKESWEYELKKLKKVPQEKVFEILKVSYKGLGFREKEIFLDIACFWSLRTRWYADYFWEARDLYPKTGVKILINKSLIKINSKGKYWIHDQLRDMGREIIRSEGLGRPEMYTRLWDPDDALKIVIQKKVSKEIIAMVLDFRSIFEEYEHSNKNFRGLSNLLYLHLEGKYQFIGDLGSIRETLLWLSWWNCNQLLKPDFFKMSNLVVLQIQGRWRGTKELIMPNLRVLVVYDSDMTTTPDVSCCIKLEMMVFVYLKNLEEIHHSVGKLESLTYLKISRCKSLRSLPKELCSARALRELIVTHCDMLQEIRGLPTSLTVLNASDCPLEEGILEEIGNLSALEKLNLSESKIRVLPAIVRRLTSLKYLSLRNCMMLKEIRGLPTSLTELDAFNCPLDEGILEEIGNLSTIEKLNLAGSEIRFLTATVSQLTSLKYLYLSGCNMLREIRGLPISLTMLNASDCPLEEGILEEIGNLSTLEILNLLGSKIRFLPATVRRLTSLKYLNLRHCKMLQEIRGLPTSLTKLDAQKCPLEEGIPEEIGNLLALKVLDLSESKIRFMPATISQLTSLKSLNLNYCDMLQELPRLPTSLTYFAFSWKTLGFSEAISCRKKEVTRVITFEGALELGFLSRRKTLGLSFPDMASPETNVSIIDFTRTEVELSGLDSLPSLTKLSIDESHDLIRVSNIGRLRRGLRWLGFSECEALVEIPGLEQLEMLEELSFHRCHSICGIQDLLGLKRLKIVNIWGCYSLVHVPRVIDECRLSISLCDKLKSFVGSHREYRELQDVSMDA